MASSTVHANAVVAERTTAVERSRGFSPVTPQICHDPSPRNPRIQGLFHFRRLRSAPRQDPSYRHSGVLLIFMHFTGVGRSGCDQGWRSAPKTKPNKIKSFLTGFLGNQYQRVPFAPVFGGLTDRMGWRSISGLVAAKIAAAGSYEMRQLAPHSSGELKARTVPQASRVAVLPDLSSHSVAIAIFDVHLVKTLIFGAVLTVRARVGSHIEHASARSRACVDAVPSADP